MEPAWLAHYGEMGRRIREFDWEATPLGAIDSWPPWLRFAVDLMLASRLPSAIHVGPEAITLYNEAAREYLGEKHPAAIGWPLFEIHPDLRTRWETSLQKVYSGETLAVTGPGSWFDFAAEAIRGHFRLSIAPLREESGSVAGAWVVFAHVTHERPEYPIPESEKRLRLAVEAGRLAIWDWTLRNDEIVWSREHFRMEGYGVGEVILSYEAWIARVHPNDRNGTQSALREAIQLKKNFVHEFRFTHPDGSANWVTARARLFHDAAAHCLRMSGVMIENNEQRQLYERQKVLIGELQHRTRNLLAIVQTLVDRTLRSTNDLPHFRVELTGRLQALSRVQNVLTDKGDSDPVPLEQILRNELAAHGVEPSDTQRVVMRGPPDVALPAAKVQVVMMAIHELATNAIKYGALKQLNARLRIEWGWMLRSDGFEWIELSWREEGVRIADLSAASSRHGLGRDLIERALPFQLGGRSSFVLNEDGIVCTIAFPLGI
jgi:two-component sensor histidine kinase